jgi:methionyl aminopeptidase
MGSVPLPAQLQAGKIASRVLKETTDQVKPRAGILSLCRFAEKKIIEYGGRPAFPCNVCIDSIAAHYTSPKDDHSAIPDSGLVKVDIGVHVDGYIIDTAKTVDIDGSLEGFVSATDDALGEAISMITPGTRLSDVGESIERIIKTYGLRPVKELTGHSIARYALHSGKSVPNYKAHGSAQAEAGECYAIEPFATSGSGISETKNAFIFSNTGLDKILEGMAEKLRMHLRQKYGSLPFASRWVQAATREIDVPELIRELLRNRVIKAYPVLAEKKGRPVAQSEHTVFVSEKGAIVLSQLD